LDFRAAAVAIAPHVITWKREEIQKIGAQYLLKKVVDQVMNPKV
jgi:hypothetical protein